MRGEARGLNGRCKLVFGEDEIDEVVRQRPVWSKFGFWAHEANEGRRGGPVIGN